MIKIFIKTLSFCLLVVFVLESCENKTKIETKEGEKKIIKKVKKISALSANNEKENINHLFVANGGSVLYMKNGERRSQARFDTDGDFVTELLKISGSHGSYENFDNYIVEDKDTINFFDDFGKISSDWMIIKGNEIINKLQLVSFVSPKEIKSENVESITSTKLIFISPEIKKFKDETSKEAEDYFTSMDDWNYYSNEISQYFKKIGISSSYPHKRFWQFEIENSKKITIDTKNKINGYLPQCLLYKKGKTPIIIYLLIDDNNLDEIKNYLK